MTTKEDMALVREVLFESNAVCACGCPDADHENYDDGESCEHDDHECVRTSKAVLAMLAKLRAERKILAARVLDLKAQVERAVL
jgi:hypothetical protein